MRAEENRRIFRETQPRDPHQGRCPECGGTKMIEDRELADLICEECGLVKEHHIPVSAVPFGLMSKGKGYQREVHFQQRGAKLMGKDPELPEDVIDAIGAEVFEKEFIHNGKCHDIGTFMGRKTISLICKKLNLGNKIADSWIQIRRRLGYGIPVPHINDLLWKRMKIRFSIVNRAFEELLHTKEAKQKVSVLQRRNIMNLNYIQAQLFRLEDPELFYSIAKFLPQLGDSKQPMLNNTRWKILIDYIIEKGMNSFTEAGTMTVYTFHWEYIRLSKEEISTHFSFFF